MKEKNIVKLSMLAQQLGGFSYDNINGELAVILKKEGLTKMANTIVNVINSELSSK